MADPQEREQTLFMLALTKEGGERQAFLDRECSGDVALRARLAALFEAHAQSAPLLDVEPKLPHTVLKAGDKSVENPVGQTIDRYKLLQRIGEGGCGIVYMAEQEEPIRRRVALKIIKPGMDTKQVIARFEAERHALALMDHPNIAKVLDAGTTERGRSYFVMELVRGVKITEYCDQNQLGTKERLEIFIQICRAIQHAHQKGIIHRDIKPSNILVTLHDGIPVPKVIDFGIAKATQGRLTDQTLFTAFEQFIGTPAYMSPEQAEMSGLDVDTRTDIYSLGVLLYELLTGRTPFDARQLLAAGLDAMRRIIRETEPTKPSTCLSTMEAEVLSSIARHRHTDSPKLVHLIRGDLDWIVMKALEKDRTRRYDTANGMAMDVERYLNEEPIVARPPSRIYRFQKLVRRNQMLFAAAVVTVLALVGGMVMSTTQAFRARRAEKTVRRERDLANSARKQAEALNKFLQEDILFQATPAANAPEQIQTLMRQTLDRAAKKLDSSEITRQPELEATLRLAVGESYRWLGEVTKAEANIRQAVNLRRSRSEAGPYETLLAEKALVCLLSFDTSIWSEEIERLSFKTWQGLKILAESSVDPPDKELWRATLDTESAYINELRMRGQLEPALSLKKANVANYDRLLGTDDPERCKAMQDFGVMLEAAGKFTEAESAYRQAIEGYTRIGQGETYPAVQSQNNLGNCRFLQGNVEGAEEILKSAYASAQRTFSAEHRLKVDIQHRLARVFAEEGRWAQAETLARETLLMRRRMLAANDGNTAYTMVVLGRVLLELGNLKEAQQLLEEARCIFVENFAGLPRLAATAENWLGAVHLARKDYDQAERFLLPMSDQLLLPTILMSPRERHICIGHIAEFYRATGKADLAAAWQSKLDALEKSEPSTQ